MASTTVDLLGPLAFIIVLELAQLARTIPIAGPDEETSRIDYDVESNAIGRSARWIAGGLWQAQAIVSAGGFYVVFVVTELVLYSSIVAVYAAEGPILLGEAVLLPPTTGVILFLGLLWFALPVLVVDRYDDLSEAGIEPFSYNVHVATTGLYSLAIVALVEVRGIAAVSEFLAATDFGTLILVAPAGYLWGLVWFKTGLFYRLLLAELDRMDETDSGNEGH